MQKPLLTISIHPHFVSIVQIRPFLQKQIFQQKQDRKILYCMQYITIIKNYIQTQIQQIMFGFLWKKPNRQFNLNNSYLVIQFLTEEEKLSKEKIVKQLQQQYKDDFQTIVPYSTSFQVSFRYTLYSATIKNKILLAEVMALVQASNNQELSQFYQSNVKKIKLHMVNDKLVNAEDVIELYNQRDVSLYNPEEVLQIIYEKRGLLERMKLKAKKFAKNLPKYLFNLLSRFLGVILRLMGLGSINSVVSSFLPFKMILKWVLNIVMVFFPALAPLIGLSKLVI